MMPSPRALMIMAACSLVANLGGIALVFALFGWEVIR